MFFIRFMDFVEMGLLKTMGLSLLLSIVLFFMLWLGCYGFRYGVDEVMMNLTVLISVKWMR